MGVSVCGVPEYGDRGPHNYDGLCPCHREKRLTHTRNARKNRSYARYLPIPPCGSSRHPAAPRGGLPATKACRGGACGEHKCVVCDVRVFACSFPSTEGHIFAADDFNLHIHAQLDIRYKRTSIHTPQPVQSRPSTQPSPSSSFQTDAHSPTRPWLHQRPRSRRWPGPGSRASTWACMYGMWID